MAVRGLRAVEAVARSTGARARPGSRAARSSRRHRAHAHDALPAARGSARRARCPRSPATPGSQPPSRSSTERRQTPEKTPVRSSCSSAPHRAPRSARSHFAEPPTPSAVSSASATRRDHGPTPRGTGGPLTQFTSPRRNRSTPHAGGSPAGKYVCASIFATNSPRAAPRPMFSAEARSPRGFSSTPHARVARRELIERRTRAVGRVAVYDRGTRSARR